ncbi:sensor histidine kinase [Pontibacter vulgaris]|uniref:sensor histidine kinase n=1 Tax=Pontibacter vulgaris TaxID=2905679 RepID=UPI001FA76782|nr:PAS domain-containing sensor histidine kinase [Pontibacter vulgaris]
MKQAGKSATQDEILSIFQGGGEMGAMMRAFDWDAHPLGNPALWPDGLKTNIRLLLNSGFPMFIWWSRDLYMFHNDAYLPALGNKHPEALGASARIMWSEIWGDIGVVVENILNGGNPFYAEELHLVLERKGFPEETYWTFSYSPAFGDTGQVAGIFCACTEVTKTVLSQRRLSTLKAISDATSLIQTVEQACQTVSNILSDNPYDIPFNLIYLLNATGTEAILSGKAGNVASEAAPDILPLTGNSPDCPLAIVQKTKQPQIIDHPSSNNETSSIGAGFTLPVKAVILPVFRPGQEHIIGFCISGLSSNLEYDSDYVSFHQLLIGQIATTITSVQAREEILKQEEYLKDIFQQAPVGITILRGPDYLVDLANPGVCEIWGRSQADVLGKPVLEALPEIADQGIKELLDSVYYSGTPYVADELPVVLEREGKLESVYLNFVYQPMYDAYGMVRGVIAVAIDISEQVAARHDIEAMNKELLAINADLDNFVYSASHDLKAPISNIEGLMNALIDYLPAETLQTDIVKKLIELIHASVDRFKRTVTDLAEVAKIQREAGEDIAQVNLADVVDEVILDFESAIAETGARIELNLVQNSVIQFSAKNARSIVYNLISNALKYSSPDRKPNISITSEEVPGYIGLYVTDNGLGVDKTDQNKMFSMFKRLHDHVEGSGIGLYIVKRIVENAGGYIEVKSEVGKGSTFKIFFKH